MYIFRCLPQLLEFILIFSLCELICDDKYFEKQVYKIYFSEAMNPYTDFT